MTVATKGYPTVAQKTPKIWPSVIASILLLIGLAPSAAAQVYTIAPQPYQQPLDDSGNIVVGGCIWTYAAGTTTPIATYSDNSGSLNSNPIIADTAGRVTIYLLAGTSYKFVYETACTPPAHGSVLKSRDNIAGVPASAANVDLTCTAGEAISAGLAVYMSDGSGSKTPGQCYKADSANTYSSSSAIVVGMTPSAIASGVPGTVRLRGSVPGLSSLSIGTPPYYVGTSGAITSTAPTNSRRLGSADTATSLVLTPDQAGVAVVNPQICQVRLSLTSGTPVTTADVTGAATVYVAPYLGNVCAFYDGSATWTNLSFAEISVALGTLTNGLPYDIFCYNNSGTMACDAPVAWTNGTTRATALTLQNGVPVKSGTTTRRFIGSFYTTAATTTEDSTRRRLLCNYYNRVPIFIRRLETTANWNYSTAAFQQANASATNQVDLLNCYQEAALSLTVNGANSQSATSTNGYVGIGINSTTTQGTGVTGGLILTQNTGGSNSGSARLDHVPALGYSYYAWLEYGAGVVTTTWYGALASASYGLTGMWIH